jgi:nicotinamidase-related amidase
MPSIEAARTGLVVNDMINHNYRRHDDEAHNRAMAASGIIDSTLRLVDGIRKRDVPTFWIRVDRRPDRADVVDNATDIKSGWHAGGATVAASYDGQLIDEVKLAPQDAELVKLRFDPFVGTGLDLLLRARGIDTMLLCGFSTNMGVESCARSAHDLGYNVVVLKDCCYNIPEELHNFSIERIMPRFARVMTVDELLAALV